MGIQRKLRQRTNKNTNTPGTKSEANIIQITKQVIEGETGNKEEVPNVLFAPDGRTFFPCKYCCRAFAHKRSLTTHLRVCSFKVVEVSDSEDEENKTKSIAKLKPIKPEIIKKADVKEVVKSTVAVPKTNGINILGNVVIKERNPINMPRKLEAKSCVQIENKVDVKREVKPTNGLVITSVYTEKPVDLIVIEENDQPRKNGKVENNIQQISKVENDTASRQRRIRMDQKLSKPLKQKNIKSTDNRAKKTIASNTTPKTIKSVQNKTTLIKEPKPVENGTTPKTKVQKVEVFKKVKCTVCRQLFENSIDLFRHKRDTHSDKKKVKLSPESLKIYDKVFQKSPKKICPLCNKPSTKIGWKRHLQTHSTEVKYFCKICKKGFNRIDHQRDHEKRHVVKI